jgi:hypothetical protein
MVGGRKRWDGLSPKRTSILLAPLNLFTGNLDENPFSSSAVKLTIENLLPRTEIELPSDERDVHAEHALK